MEINLYNMDTEIVCKNCLFFRSYNSYKYRPLDWRDWGMCRRFPQVVVGLLDNNQVKEMQEKGLQHPGIKADFAFVEVRKTDWCGEFHNNE